ncbi:maleylacetoacetate isomerase [Sphingomonas jejuensis]|uniref:Maleylacetoacetate isomerase n=1 Tax=Sphingomonas jejuensis TaxID=904715 RepID=A0ABX0XP13_9SPHN|nr:maleylacetoacetate isomerase [Sphingomonas jejuensis]
MQIRLFDYWRSSASYRARIALALKGAPYERVPVSLADGEQLSDAHRARNPQGFVPALEADGTVISQSLAIVDWLDGRIPEPRLIPVEPLARARALQATMLIAADIHPLNNLRVLKHLKNDLGLSEDARDDWVRHWVREGFEALERLAAADAGRFLGGDAPGIADVFLVPQMYNARRFALDLAPFPTLVRVDAEAQAHPAFQDAHPDRVKRTA